MPLKNEVGLFLHKRALSISGAVIVILVGWLFVLIMEIRKEDREYKLWVSNRLDFFLERMIKLESRIDILELDMLKKRKSLDPYSPKTRKGLN